MRMEHCPSPVGWLSSHPLSFPCGMAILRPRAVHTTQHAPIWCALFLAAPCCFLCQLVQMGLAFPGSGPLKHTRAGSESFEVCCVLSCCLVSSPFLTLVERHSAAASLLSPGLCSVEQRWWPPFGGAHGSPCKLCSGAAGFLSVQWRGACRAVGTFLSLTF